MLPVKTQVSEFQRLRGELINWMAGQPPTVEPATLSCVLMSFSQEVNKCLVENGHVRFSAIQNSAKINPLVFRNSFYHKLKWFGHPLFFRTQHRLPGHQPSMTQANPIHRNVPPSSRKTDSVFYTHKFLNMLSQRRLDGENNNKIL